MSGEIKSYAHAYGGIHRIHGATKWLFLFSTALTRRGLRSEIFCTNLSVPLPYWFEGRVTALVGSLTINKEISGLKKFMYTLYQLLGTMFMPLLRMQRADCIVYHAEMGLWASILGKLRFPKARHIYYCYQPPRELYDLRQGTRKHFGIWYFLFYPLLETYKLLDRWLVGKMDLVLVWSPEYEDYARSIYGDIRISQVPAAVDFDFIQNVGNKDERIRQLRNKYGLEEDRLLLTASALNWKKNLHLLIKLVARLRKEGLSVKGVIVGEGPERNGLEELAGKLGVRENILITGFVPQEDLPLFYHAADIVYFLEPNGAWTMSTIEAGAAATPVITASGGSMETLVIDSKSGFIIPDIEDLDHLSKVTLELLSNENKRLEMGRKNLQHSEQFSLDASITKFISAAGER